MSIFVMNKGWQKNAVDAENPLFPFPPGMYQKSLLLMDFPGLMSA